MKLSNSKERIKELLSVYGISQAEFCKRTGIKSSALSNYLKGTREPRQDKIAQIADTFGIDPAWLMGYDVSMQREVQVTNRLLMYYTKLSELSAADQELIFNQIDFLKGRKTNEEN